jgi:TetR/AcrR family transcriptional regulator, transcriptional repressor for nem operon
MAAGRPRGFDETDVLEKATQVFWSQGYKATSVAHLEEATGLGRQSLYNAFGGKRALFQASLTHYEDTRAAEFSAGLAGAADPMATIQHVVGSWAKAARANSCRGCLLLNTASEFGGRDPDMVATVTHVLQAQHQALAATLTRAQAAGQLAADANPVALARRLQATLHGLTLMSRLDPDDAVLDDVVADTLSSLRRMSAT